MNTWLLVHIFSPSPSQNLFLTMHVQQGTGVGIHSKFSECVHEFWVNEWMNGSFIVHSLKIVGKMTENMLSDALLSKGVQKNFGCAAGLRRPLRGAVHSFIFIHKDRQIHSSGHIHSLRILEWMPTPAVVYLPNFSIHGTAEKLGMWPRATW